MKPATSLRHVVVLLVALASANGSTQQHQGAGERSRSDSDSYVVAVVEFRPELTNMPMHQRTGIHLQEYIRLIASDDAKTADMIVFPELTLNSLSDPVYVPDPEEHYVPCTESMDNILITLSCLAIETKKYLVINLSEIYIDQYLPNPVRYNTDVVLDRSGAVIARYRKFNLFMEPGTNVTSAPEIVTFTTDFGVTFGVFTCFDILFARPTLELIKLGVKDFVFPAFWTSEPPFLTSTQIYESWAYANDVNLITSGTNFDTSGATGTGVFNGRNGALLAYFSGTPTRKIFTVTVPKIGTNVKQSSAGESFVEDAPDARLDRVPGSNLENVNMGRDHLDQFTTMQINPEWYNDVVGQIVCNGVFCCDFTVNVSIAQDLETTHYYRFAVFDGVRTFQGYADAHVSICGVIACRNQSLSSCGYMLPQNSGYMMFNSITITGQFGANGTLAMPNSLDHLLYSYDPSYYQFTASIDYPKNQQQINLSLTSPVSNLQTFGIYAFNHKNFEFYNPIELPVVEVTTAEPLDNAQSGSAPGVLLLLTLLAGSVLLL